MAEPATNYLKPCNGNTGDGGSQWQQRITHSKHEKAGDMEIAIDLEIAVGTVADRADMERRLDEAVAIAMTWATQEGRRGILVTRHDRDSFTVALSDAVPFGLTREHQNW